MKTTIVIQYKDATGEWVDDPDATPSKSLLAALRKLRRVAHDSPSFKYRLAKATVATTGVIKFKEGDFTIPTPTWRY